ncbi:hypothetical protein RJT34_23227 [Clitoria ternatea]|uniref:Uncharacterized protein n=1 Tax=Clitoria ternatea TaxID=43366 RepID=A0AAN9FKP3_CLITE
MLFCYSTTVSSTKGWYLHEFFPLLELRRPHVIFITKKKVLFFRFVNDDLRLNKNHEFAPRPSAAPPTSFVASRASFAPD